MFILESIQGEGQPLFGRLLALSIILLLPKFVLADPALPFQYKELEDNSLAFKIGEMLFMQPSEGCWTCHGAENLEQSQPDLTKKNSIRAILSDPTTWTSHKIAQNYFPNGETELHQRQIALSLIRLGANDWNSSMVPVIRKLSSGDALFFDDRMIGIHSKYLKKNSRKVLRILKKNRVKFRSKELMDIMATPVFHYLEDTYHNARIDD